MDSDNRGSTVPPSSRPPASTAQQDALLLHVGARAREAATHYHAAERTDAVNQVLADVIPDIRAGHFPPGDQSITGVAWTRVKRVLRSAQRKSSRRAVLLAVNADETVPRYARGMGDAANLEKINQLIVIYDTLLGELPDMVARVMRHMVDTDDSYVETGIKFGLSRHTARKYRTLGEKYFAHNLRRFDVPLPRNVAREIPLIDRRRMS